MARPRIKDALADALASGASRIEEEFFGFVSISKLLSLSLSLSLSLYLQSGFSRLFTPGKKLGERGTRTSKKRVNYRVISPEK